MRGGATRLGLRTHEFIDLLHDSALFTEQGMALLRIPGGAGTFGECVKLIGQFPKSFLNHSACFAPADGSRRLTPLPASFHSRVVENNLTAVDFAAKTLGLKQGQC